MNCPSAVTPRPQATKSMAGSTSLSRRPAAVSSARRRAMRGWRSRSPNKKTGAIGAPDGAIHENLLETHSLRCSRSPLPRRPRRIRRARAELRAALGEAFRAPATHPAPDFDGPDPGHLLRRAPLRKASPRASSPTSRYPKPAGRKSPAWCSCTAAAARPTSNGCASGMIAATPPSRWTSKASSRATTTRIARATTSAAPSAPACSTIWTAPGKTNGCSTPW